MELSDLQSATMKNKLSLLTRVDVFVSSFLPTKVVGVV